MTDNILYFSKLRTEASMVPVPNVLFLLPTRLAYHKSGLVYFINESGLVIGTVQIATKFTELARMMRTEIIAAPPDTDFTGWIHLFGTQHSSDGERALYFRRLEALTAHGPDVEITLPD